MVVVVIDPVFVKRRGPGRLDASNETLLDKHPQRVVDSLSRDGTDIRPDILCEGVSRAVWPSRDRTKYGEALGRDLDAVFSEDGGKVSGLDDVLGPILDIVKY